MQEHSYEHNTDQKVDLELIFRNFLHVLKRTWWWVTLLAILVGALRYVQAQRSFVPQYTATASFSVKSGYVGTTDLVDSTQYYDNQAAEQVVSSFPYIIRSEAMQERICLALNTSWINGTVTASSIGETNIFTLTVTSTNPQDAYDILNAVIQNYPQVASFVIGGTQLSMIEEPQVPTVPVNTFRGSRSAAKGVAAGLLLGLALTLLMAIGRKTVRTADDLKRSTSVPCMGTIPAIQVKRRRKAAGSGVSILNPHLGDTLSVPIGALQVRLLRSQPAGGTGRIILVTSTMPGEGKTTVSFNLAASLAQSGKRVILVDADLRHQVVKARFGITTPSAGLLELSRAAKPDIARVLIPVPGVANLSLLAGDTRMTSPMGILDSPKMRSLLERTRTLADYVIIDAPPAGLLADAAVLCRSADQVLYVVRYDSFARNQVADAMHSVSGRGAELTGYVINGRPTRRGRGYGYGYDRYGYGKYGYGTKYGYGKNGSRKQDDAHRSSGDLGRG